MNNIIKKTKQTGVAGGGMIILGLMIISLWLSIMGVRYYSLLSSYKSESVKFISSDTEIYTNINFYPLIWQMKHMEKGKEGEEVKEFKKILSELEEKQGVNIEEILLEYIEPEISLSLFRTDKVYNYGKALAKLNKAKKEIALLSENLKIFYELNNEYPSELEELVPDYMEKLPEGKYIYRAEGTENHVFILESYENEHKDAGITGNYPAYRGEKGAGNFIPYKEEIPETAYPEWLILGALKDRDTFNDFIKAKATWKAEKTEVYENTEIFQVEKSNINYCVKEKNLLVASDIELIKKSIDTGMEKIENIEKNELYKEFKEKMPDTTMAFTFVNFEKILPPIYNEVTSEPWSKIGKPELEAMKSMGFIVSGTTGGLKVDSYLKMNKESESTIIKLLLENDTPDLNSLKLVPYDVTMASST